MFSDSEFPSIPEILSGGSLVAIGGELTPARILRAYAKGVFPWYETPPVLWYSPEPRFVLFPESFRVPKSLRKKVKQSPFTIKSDSDFASVIFHCAEQRAGQTWITPAMQEAYTALHRQGYAHSVEAYKEGKLVGGLYGISLGGVFFGESMFYHENDASKIALVYLYRALYEDGFQLIDCQDYTEHLARFGASEIPREDFYVVLLQALEQPTRVGHWELANNQLWVKDLMS